MPYIEGGCNCTAGKGGSTEKGGGWEDGEGDERGEEGSVDGVTQGTRVGKKRSMPWVLVKDGIGWKFSVIDHYVFGLVFKSYFDCSSTLLYSWKPS